jgi:integrase
LLETFVYQSLSGEGDKWPQIAQWVGHVNQKTTQLYTHFNTAKSRKKMEALEITF